jgi:hypothetical protein
LLFAQFTPLLYDRIGKMTVAFSVYMPYNHVQRTVGSNFLRSDME